LANSAETATLATIAIVVEIGLASVARAEFRISMQTGRIRFTTAAIAIAIAAMLASSLSYAARVGILSDGYASETATDFNANVPGHTFSAVDVSTAVPPLAVLMANYDVLLLFEDNTFANAPTVGAVVAAYANAGHPVVLGTFYDQDRSDAPPTFTPHGWGALETIDPNTTDGSGTSYATRSLDPASIVAHPLTAGVTTLTAARFAGGNQPKLGTVVVAKWAQLNAKGGVDPAIAYRVTGAACVIHVAIAPNYPIIAIPGIDFGGDFYRVWRNAFDFGANLCGTSGNPPVKPVTPGTPASDPNSIPTLSHAALALTALLLLGIGGIARRRPRR
jgi:IPTL-CTERM motif